MKNLQAKTVKPIDAYQAYSNGSWTWLVLKHYQSEESEARNPFARVLCLVDGDDLEMGDVYLREITANARLLEGDEAQAERARIAQELRSIPEELQHKPDTQVDVLQLLKQINDCLHEWDNGREGEMRAQEWWNVRQTIQEAGYDIHEVAIWDSEGDMIIRRDLAIAPRMEAS